MVMRCSISGHVGLEERSPEPKPRWNPKPEQIRILEAIFNSGMVNPPRDEIRKIRTQLQEYGQVGDANVFYWFQNRKSRSKHKQRLLAAKSHAPTTNNPSSSVESITRPPQPIATTATNNTSTTTNSNSSSSEKTSNAVSFASFMDQSVQSPSNSTVASVNQIGSYNQQTILHQLVAQDSRPVSFLNAPFSFTNSGVCELSSTVQFQEQLKQVEKLNVIEGSNSEQNCTINPMLQDFEEYVSGLTRSTVFINDLAFEVSSLPLNVKEAFGDTAVLLHSSGQPVMTDEFGVTLQPLQNGGFYYLV